jgi:hypothetical protein
MKSYVRHETKMIERANGDGSTSFIPSDPNNMDYARLLDEVVAGTSEVRDEQGALVDMSQAIAERQRLLR